MGFYLRLLEISKLSESFQFFINIFMLSIEFN